MHYFSIARAHILEYPRELGSHAPIFFIDMSVPLPPALESSESTPVTEESTPVAEESTPVAAKRPRGRPVGSRNRPKPPIIIEREVEVEVEVERKRNKNMFIGGVVTLIIAYIFTNRALNLQ